MKKAINLKFLALSLLLMVGNVFAFAQDPVVGQAVGASQGIVTYRVNNDFADVEVSGEKTYPVTITGLDADGLAQLGTNVVLEVPVTFREKLGEKYYRFYVTQIADGEDAFGNPQSFYGYTEISKLEFKAVKTGVNNNEPYYGLDKFTYSVGDKAFYGCKGMKTLTFTENCKTIGKYAFQNTAIRTFEIPKGCQTIDEYAFYNCGFIHTVTVATGNEAMTTLGTHVFGNSSLETLDLRQATKLTTIAGEPFMYDLSIVNDVLKRVLLPTSIEDINTAFANCTALVGFGAEIVSDADGNLDKTKLVAVEDGAFAGCRSLARLDLPNCNVEGIPFVGCKKLETITFVDKYDKTIGTVYTAMPAVDATNLFGLANPNNDYYVAEDQAALKTITFKGSFRGTIVDNAFVGTALETLTFTNGLQYGATINAAFTDVKSLATVTFGSGEGFTGVDTWNQLTTAEKNDKDIKIAGAAFQNTGITSLNFGAIKLAYANAANFTIEESAFSNCENLATVTFGDFEVRKNGNLAANFQIKGGAFTHNANLATVTFGKSTFLSNKGVLKIWDNAFADGNEALATVSFGDFVNSEGNNGYTGTTAIGWNNDLETSIDFANDFINKVDGLVFGDGKHLTTVTFGDFSNNKKGSLEAGLMIANGAFASTGLTTVKFGNIKGAKNVVSSGFAIGKRSFKGGNVSAKTVTFGSVSDNGTGKLGFTVLEEAFAAEKLQTVTFGDLSAANMTIQTKAFEGAALTTVEIGNITASANNNTILQIAEKAFWEGDDAVALEVNRPAAKTVTIKEISDNIAKGKQLEVDIHANAFYGKALQTVKIAEKSAADASKLGTIGATKVTIGESAFAGDNLATVTIGNIKNGITAASTFTVANDAFYGGEEADKTVTIGTITDDPTNAKLLTATLGNDAFSGKALKTVTIGDMTANSLTIGTKAFAGEKLETVTLGKMTATTLSVGGEAFANENIEDVMTENITIDEIGAGLTINPDSYAFKGPQKGGSTAAYNVTIAAITGAANIGGNAFVAPAEGTATYTVTGDVAAGALANVQAGAFTGSQVYEKGAPVDNNTNVWFQGDYNDEFTAAGIFTNVNDVKVAVAKDKDTEGRWVAKNYNVAGKLKAFSGAKTVMIGTIPASKEVRANVAECNNIEEVTFVGSVEGNIREFTSPKIRKIDFANVDKEEIFVVEGAVRNTAFQAAAADAEASSENITVRYYEGKDGQTREAKKIFLQQAFGTSDADAESVTLYTTPWTKANIFEAADVKAKKDLGEYHAVYRLTYSESPVAPGDEIKVDVYKKEGNTYAYGKLYIPKGVNMKYRIDAEYNPTERKNAVQLYYGRIDNSNNEISMYNLPVIDGAYWINATEVDQTLVVRTNTSLRGNDPVVGVPVTAEEDADFTPGDADHYYWNAALAVQNQLRYAVRDIIHSELMNNEEFKDRNVYYMANPVKRDFSFVKFDKTAKYTADTGDYLAGDYKSLTQKSLYIVGKVNTSAPELKIVFVDEENDANLTGIENVKTAEQNNDAIYNLQGVRVNKAQKGIFIMNGKKFVVK